MLSGSTRDDCLYWLIRVEYDHVLARKMNLLVNEQLNQKLWNYKDGTYLKAFNWRDMFMDVEVENLPNPFRCSDVLAINALFNFVVFILKSSSIRTFINMLETVFNCAKHCNRFDIGVAMKFGRNVWVVWDDPPVIHLDRSDTRYSDREWLPIIWTHIQRIPIFSCTCVILERLRVTLWAFAISHAGRRWIEIPTWPVNHCCLNGFKQ